MNEKILLSKIELLLIFDIAIVLRRLTILSQGVFWTLFLCHEIIFWYLWFYYCKFSLVKMSKYSKRLLNVNIYIHMYNMQITSSMLDEFSNINSASPLLEYVYNSLETWIQQLSSDMHTPIIEIESNETYIF